MTHAVLRLARAAHEGPGGLRPQGHRPRPQRRRRPVRRRHRCSSPRTRPQALHKISEIYDRIALRRGRQYNEFENLRVAGVRLADLRGYSYDRRDVTGRGLANAYAQTLGTIFTAAARSRTRSRSSSPRSATRADDDQIYRLTYDGSVADEHGFVVMGGSAEPVEDYLGALREGCARRGAGPRASALVSGSAVEAARRSARAAPCSTVPDRSRAGRASPRADLEVAVLGPRRAPLARKFSRLDGRRAPSVAEAGPAERRPTPTRRDSSS